MIKVRAVLGLGVGLAASAFAGLAYLETSLAQSTASSQDFDSTLYWGGGAVLESSPVPVIEVDLDSEAVYGLGKRKYKATVLRFSEHRGKWILMAPFNFSSEINRRNDIQGQHRLYRDYIRLSREYPDMEMWVVRLDSRLQLTEPAVPASFNATCGDRDPSGGFCYDRFIYTAVAPGEDGMWVEPQKRWLGWFRSHLTGEISENREWDDVNSVYVIAPDGRPYELRYREKEGVERALRLLRAEYGEGPKPAPLIRDYRSPITNLLVSG